MPQTVATMLCEACHKGGAEPHEHMKLQGVLPTDANDGSIDRQYRCVACNTVWVCHFDKWGATSGFKLVPTFELPARLVDADEPI